MEIPSVGHLHIRLNEDLQADLDAASGFLNLTYSATVRLAMREFCQRHGFRMLGRTEEGLRVQVPEGGPHA